jgi:Zn-dependent protease
MFGLGGTSRPLFRFRLAGIPVQVQPWFVVVAGLSALSLGNPARALIWLAIVTTSVLWHELGHALTMRSFGYAAWIELHAMGGLAHWARGADPSALQALAVTVAGPGAGLLLGGAVWAVAQGAGPLPPLASLAVDWMVWVNVAWSLFNLLPMLPLDGGHLLDHLSRLVSGATRPTWVGWASTLTGGAVVLFGMSRGTPYLALLGAMGAAQGIARVRARRSRSPDGGGLEALRERVRRATARGELDDVADALLPEARVGALPERELTQLVGALVELGRHDELVSLCRDRLRAFARRDDVEPLARVAGEALADAEAYEHALDVAQTAFRQLNVPYHAYDAACHLARLDRLDEAMEWLRRAIDAGLDCAAMLEAEPALEPLRARADFLDLARGRAPLH